MSDEQLHIDEGTIHAWLDNALDDVTARTVKQHVAQCERCQQVVAEARGLIAGASRVVGMLDEQSAPVLRPTTFSERQREASLWRFLRITPARASIAAMLIVAVGIVLTRKGVGVDERVKSDSVQFVATAPASAARDTMLNSAIVKKLKAEQPVPVMKRAAEVGVVIPSNAAAPASAASDEAVNRVATARAAVAQVRKDLAPVMADRSHTGAADQKARAAEGALQGRAAGVALSEVVTTSVAAPSSAGIASSCLRIESASVARWGDAPLPVILAFDSTGAEARVLSPSGKDIEARAVVSSAANGTIELVLRRIGYTGSMHIAAGTGSMQSASARPESQSTRAAAMAPAAAASVAISSARVSCP